MKPIAVLIDLDDTLLEVNLDRFTQAYFQSLTDYVASYGIGDGFAKALGEGTKKMLHNEDPTITLEEAFAKNFYPAVNAFLPQHLQSSHHHSKQNPHPLHPIFVEFYENVFPRLKEITRQKEGSRELIVYLMQQGYPVAIATNPLFPQTATYQRLRWAGVAPEEFSYQVISSYEDFHFTKPNPAYFAEVLAHLGWQADGALMIGNDLVDDIKPAQTLGLTTFLVKSDGKSLSRHKDAADNTIQTAEGELYEAFPWIKSLDPTHIKINVHSRAAAKAIMGSTAAVLDTWRRKMSQAEKWLQKNTPGTWSPLEVLCHLGDVEAEIYQPRIWKIISEENPFFSDIDASAWSEERGYQKRELEQGFEDFIGKRMETLRMIETLGEEDWQRRAVHERKGSLDLTGLICSIAEHDIQHIRQIYEQLH